MKLNDSGLVCRINTSAQLQFIVYCMGLTKFGGGGCGMPLNFKLNWGRGQFAPVPPPILQCV